MGFNGCETIRMGDCGRPRVWGEQETSGHAHRRGRETRAEQRRGRETRAQQSRHTPSADRPTLKRVHLRVSQLPSIVRPGSVRWRLSQEVRTRAG
jgi:hypothetical protein